MELQLKSGTALVVVAHPDDETIWMGGTILRNPQLQWTILSLCRADDQDRQPKFMKVMAEYGARGIISDLEDDEVLGIKASIPEIHQRIAKLVREKHFDYLFFHGANGEYGHPRHKGVHRAVKELLKTKRLTARGVFNFAYELDTIHNIGVPRKKVDFAETLSRAEFQKKRNIIQNVYGFSENSFEVQSAGQTETFNHCVI